MDASDTRTHKIPSKLGAGGKDHFVTAKGAGNITLSVAITPDTPALRAAITWEAVGAAIVSPVGPDRLKAQISRAVASGTKVTVRIKVGALTCREFFVWIVWSTLAADADATHTSFIDGTPLGLHDGRHPTSYVRKAGIDWTATIEPAEVITDADRPALEDQARQAPPGENNGVPGPGNLDTTGSGFSGWDISRQKRRKVFKGNPPGTPLAETTAADPDPFARPAGFPADDVEGNDDSDCGADEDSNPYDAGAGVPGKGTRGTLRSNDEPSTPFDDATGADGDTFRKRIHFREFVRVQLDTTWYRCSDLGLWRFHMFAKRVAGKWDIEPAQVDLFDLTNDGF